MRAHDLEKFNKLNSLKVSQNRINSLTSASSKSLKIGRPLRILFYYKKKANDKKFYEILENEKLKDSWDLCVVINKNLVSLNSTLPYVQNKIQKEYPNAKCRVIQDYPLLKAMFLTCAFIESNFVDSWTLFANLYMVTEQAQKIDSS